MEDRRDLLKISEDGRLSAETKLDAFCERIAEVTGAPEKGLKHCLNCIIEDAVEERGEKKVVKRSDDPLADEALELLSRRTKDWIKPEDSDIVSLLRMMHKSQFFEDLNASKRFLKGIEEQARKICIELDKRDNE